LASLVLSSHIERRRTEEEEDRRRRRKKKMVYFCDFVYRSADNVGSACAEPFAPYSGSFLKGTARFYPSGSRKPLSFL
jgi:hypothetical protein